MSLEAASALIAYPARAAFGRTLPKNKIYEHAGANAKLKNLFIAQVEQIVWQYKLAPETINLTAQAGVPEIQVFSIQLKTPKLNLDVLRCIDSAVQYPILFELSFDGRTQVIAAYKRPSGLEANPWLLSQYFATAWFSNDTERAVMPLALDLAGLYEQLLRRLVPTAARAGESLAECIARAKQATLMQRKVDQTASKLAKEKQFNRKVEINAQLRKLMNELQELLK